MPHENPNNSVKSSGEKTLDLQKSDSSLFPNTWRYLKRLKKEAQVNSQRWTNIDPEVSTKPLDSNKGTGEGVGGIRYQITYQESPTSPRPERLLYREEELDLRPT